MKRTKGIGPQGLGIKGNNGYEIGSPSKKTTRSEKIMARSEKNAYEGRKAVDEGRDKRADRLLRRAARQEDRAIRIEEREKSPVKQTRTRTVEKGYDPVNEAVDPGYKKVVITRGDKRIVKEKYTDESGRKRKLKTKYKGYSGTFVAQPDVVVSKTFTAKGGGDGRQKEDLLESPVKKKDACYSKVKSRYKKWPSAYASGALVKCRKVGAANWGNKSK